MATKTVYNIADAIAVDAHEDQVTAGLFHIPAGATEVEPPSFNAETQTCQFIGDTWVVESIPEPEPEPVPAGAVTWDEKRQAEYPSVADLVVALYDTDDKSAVEAKRAAVKAKYPKP